MTEKFPWDTRALEKATYKPIDSSTGGMSIREYAAIRLKVPMSGDKDIDEMILLSLRDDLVQMHCAGGMGVDSAVKYSAETLLAMYPQGAKP